MPLTPRYTKYELEILVACIYSEERRHLFTTAKWGGAGFRHFLDPKIVCLEHYRPKPRPQHNPARPHQKPAA